MVRFNLWCSRVLAPALAFCLGCQPGFAQTLGDWTRVEVLSIDSALSIKTKAGEKYHGNLVAVTTDAIAIDCDEPGFPGRTVRRREFGRNQVREIRLVKPVASLAVGTAIGAAGGAGIGVALEATAKSHEYRGVTALVLGLLGAAIGAAIALHHPLAKSKIYLAP